MLMNVKSATATVGVMALIALSLSACSAGDDENGKGVTDVANVSTADTESGVVALLLPEKNTARYESADRPFFEAKFESLCPGVELIYSNAGDDVANQQQQAEAALSQGATVLVLGSVDSEAAGQIVTEAQGSGAKVISYDRLIKGDSEPDYLVTFDNEYVGTLQAKALMEEFNAQGVDDPRLVWINGSSKTAESAVFERGATEALGGSVSIVKSGEMPNWKPEEAQQLVEAQIASDGADSFDGVYVANDGGAGGVYAALNAAGIDPASKPTTGQDAELAGVQRILAGQQFMTVYKPLQKLAEASATLACNLVKGESEAWPSDAEPTTVDNESGDIPAMLIPPIAVTVDGELEGTESIADTLVADLFYGDDTVAQICTTEFADACKAAGIQ